MKQAIAYIRVSTQKQGRSGLGLEAQQAAIAAFAAAEGFTVDQTFVEIETGKGADALKRRPQLAAAIIAAKGQTLVVAKLDRLTRDVEFGAGLFNRTDLAFRVSDMPHANNFLLNIMLCVAQQEREMISQRTKDALKAARERGTKLGSPTTAGILKDRSLTFAETLRAVVTPLVHLTSRQIAEHLNTKGIMTAGGKTWQSMQVCRLLDRLEIA
jgi:DNA invertase Pin-like site-specific DNA recombinase